MRWKAILVIMSIILLSSSATGGFSLGVSAAAENIALGKKYTIESGAANEYSYAQTEKGAKDQLTDGITGDPKEHYSGKWSHFVRGISRTVTVDLEKTMAVTGFDSGFIQNAAAGIYCPQEVVYSVSENGTDFMTIAKVENSVENTVSVPTRVSYKYQSTKAYKARYVRVYFDSQVNTFLDEIMVFGSDSAETALQVEPDDKENNDVYYQKGENIGAKDIVCFHYGYWPQDETLANNKKDVFKPYLGYIDTKGKYVDTMFDAVMFLIIQGNSPSGKTLGVDGSPSKMSDWEYLIENTFAKDINLDALDQATAELKEQLSLPDEHKTAVYLSVPHPKISDIEFGDFDGDGKTDKILSLEDCVKVYSWYVDRIIKTFNEKNYKNIDLKGFFWSSESLEGSKYDKEPELASLCIKELHKRNKQCIFIPFYQASGVEKAHQLGFDSTIMQANLSFNKPLQENPEKMMEDFAYTAGKYHTGIQMEIHHSFLYDIDAYAPLYTQYLVSSAKNGMMKDSIHAYYQGAGYGIFYKCAYSSDPLVRWFYDATYKFIKGTLSFPDFNIKITENGTTKQGEIFRGEFDIEGDWNNDSFKLSVGNQPQHGTIRVDTISGKYIYRPDREFLGTDNFSLKYTDQSGVLKDVPITINVVSKDPSSDTASNEESKTTESKPLKWGLLIGMAVGVAAAVTATFFILRKKKK